MKTTYQHGINLGRKYLALHKRFASMTFLEILANLRIDNYDMRRWTASKYYRASRKPIPNKAYYIKDNILWRYNLVTGFVPWRGITH
jgi:hypothetical protein